MEINDIQCKHVAISHFWCHIQCKKRRTVGRPSFLPCVILGGVRHQTLHPRPQKVSPAGGLLEAAKVLQPQPSSSRGHKWLSDVWSLGSLGAVDYKYLSKWLPCTRPLLATDSACHEVPQSGAFLSMVMSGGGWAQHSLQFWNEDSLEDRRILWSKRQQSDASLRESGRSKWPSVCHLTM